MGAPSLWLSTSHVLGAQRREHRGRGDLRVRVVSEVDSLGDSAEDVIGHLVELGGKGTSRDPHACRIARRLAVAAPARAAHSRPRLASAPPLRCCVSALGRFAHPELVRPAPRRAAQRERVRSTPGACPVVSVELVAPSMAQMPDAR